MLSRHFMLHLYSAHFATLVLDWVGLFSSSGAAGTNLCLDLSCRSCRLCGDRSLIGDVLAPYRGELQTVRLFGGEPQLVECLLK